MALRKIAFVVSDINKSLALEWIIDGLRTKFDVHLVTIGPSYSELNTFAVHASIPLTVVSDDEYRSYWQIWWRVYRVLAELKPDIIHAHLWRANLVALTTSWLLRVKKRVYTRHHAMIHYNQFRSGRKWDLLCNILATDIIAISRIVQEILIDRDGARPGKVHLVHHGFDLDYFQRVNDTRIQQVRTRNRLAEIGRPIVGVIARYTAWKGIQYIIPAFWNLLKVYPNAHLILANANGDYAGEIRELLRSLPVGSYTEILYEVDLAALYQLFDVYVHVPIDRHSEAFGQTYVEALAAGIPSVFSLSGVASEFIVDRQNALVVDYESSHEIENAIMTILTDKELRERLIVAGKAAVRDFTIKKMVSKIEQVYG